MNISFASFVLLFHDLVLDQKEYFTFKPTLLQCAHYCVNEHRCRAVSCYADMRTCLAHGAVRIRKDARLGKRPGYKGNRSNLLYSPNTCLDVQLDHPEAKDGEYEIFPLAHQFHGKAVKVFCLMSVNPPEEYVSLNYQNYGDFPNRESNSYGCNVQGKYVSGADVKKKTGKVQYKKIRVVPDTMTIVRNDTRFCVTMRENACMYGRSEDCFSPSCGAIGTFSGSTDGTGMKLNQKLKWEKYGRKSHDPKVTWYHHGMNVYVTCGGKCGGCDVVGEMTLYPHP